MHLLFCTYLLLFLVKPHSELFVPFINSFVSSCPISRYQPSNRHLALPNCMPSRWKAGDMACRRSMRLSTRGHLSTSKSQCDLWMAQILKKACKNKYGSGLLSVGKPYTKITDAICSFFKMDYILAKNNNDNNYIKDDRWVKDMMQFFVLSINLFRN